MARRQPKVGDPDYRHPYTAFEGGPLWKLLEHGIADLVDNHDLIEEEDRNYIVGYLCKVVVEGLAGNSAAEDSHSGGDESG